MLIITATHLMFLGLTLAGINLFTRSMALLAFLNLTFAAGVALLLFSIS